MVDQEVVPHCAEVQFSVPWGHISGKLWGKATGQPVLVLHGWLDNCGSFDRLISLLVGDYHILALDLPGHGLSSHFPAGLPIDFLNFVIATKFVVDEMKWPSFVFMGHSYGGQVATYFTACFPALVQKLVVIDSIAVRPMDDDLLDPIRLWIEQSMQLEKRLSKRSPPVYTYEEALNKFIDRYTPLTSEAAAILIKRSLKPVENGYVFRMDQRMKIDPFPSICSEIQTTVVEHLRCPVLLICSSERYDLHKDLLFNDIFAVISKQPNFKVVTVEGGHDLHQNNPERVVKLIDEFLMGNSKL